MGDSTKPGPYGEEGKILELPTAKIAADSGQHVVAPVAPEMTVQGTASENAAANDKVDTGTEPVDGLRATIADHVGGTLGQLVEVDFSRARRNGLKGSHAPKSLKTSQAKPLAKIALKKRAKPLGPKPPKVDGLNILPTPQVDVIRAGRRETRSLASLEHDRSMTKIAGRERLRNVEGIISDELEQLEPKKSLTSDDVNSAINKLLALRKEDFAIQKRSTDNTFFFEVAKILLILFWPRNYQRFLNDRRIEDMMREIQENATQMRIWGIISNWIRP